MLNQFQLGVSDNDNKCTHHNVKTCCCTTKRWESVLMFLLQLTSVITVLDVALLSCCLFQTCLAFILLLLLFHDVLQII